MVRTVQDTILDIVEDDSDYDDGTCAVDAESMEMFVEGTETRTLQSVRLTEFHGKKAGIDVQVDCPHDSEQWVRNVGGVGSDDLSGLSDAEKGDIAEQHAAPTFARERGLLVAYVEGTGETGFDVVACDDRNSDGDCDAETDTFHIIEAKFKSKSGSVGIGYLPETTTKSRQMSDEWIRETTEQMVQSSDNSTREIGRELDTADSVRKEVVAVQNAEQNTKTITESLTRDGIEIDRVHIVKLRKVIDS